MFFVKEIWSSRPVAGSAIMWQRYVKLSALIGDGFVCRDVMSSQAVVDFVSQRLPSVSTPIIAIVKYSHLSLLSSHISCNSLVTAKMFFCIPSLHE